MKLTTYLKFYIAKLISVFARFVLKFPQKNTFIFLDKQDDPERNASEALSKKLITLGYNCKIIPVDRFHFYLHSLAGLTRVRLGEAQSKDIYGIAYAKGLAIYQPRVIVQFDDGNALSKYIMNYSGAKLVNIAHGVTGRSEYFASIDFHYDFLYGKSSVDNLRNNPFVRAGQTTIVSIGPLYCELEKKSTVNCDAFFLEMQGYRLKIIYSSSFTGNQEVMSYIIPAHEELLKYAENNPETAVAVKLHPLERESDYWYRATNYKNLFILPNGCLPSDICKHFDFHVTMGSNSCIDYGLRGLDTIALRPVEYAEYYLQLGKYFGVARDHFQLRELLINYNKENSKLRDFLKYHCEFTDLRTVDRVVYNLKEIADGRELEGVVFTVA